jgi:hypothetical protein
LAYVLSGYDVYLGNPSPTSAMIDPGFQSKIFDERYSGTTMDGMEGSCRSRTG